VITCIGSGRIERFVQALSEEHHLLKEARTLLWIHRIIVRLSMKNTRLIENKKNIRPDRLSSKKKKDRIAL
jgi:hypothetical protein